MGGQTGPRPASPKRSPKIQGMTRATVSRELPALLDRLDANGRYALLKLATGAMRIGISARLAKVAFAQAFEVSVDDVEEYWHGQFAPYTELFDWAANGAPAPDASHVPLFRPFMLAHPLEGPGYGDASRLRELRRGGKGWHPRPLVHVNGEPGLFALGDDISRVPRRSPRVVVPAVLDGELLVRGAHQGGPDTTGLRAAGELQRAPAAARAQDRVEAMLADSRFRQALRLLIREDDDLRPLSWSSAAPSRDVRPPARPGAFDLSSVIGRQPRRLAAIRERARDDASRG